MKKLFVFLVLVLVFSVFVFGVVDDVVIRSRMNEIESVIRSNDLNEVLGLVSPTAVPSLRDDIVNNYKGVTNFNQVLRSVEVLEDNKIRVVTRFSAEGVGWSVSGFSNYYVLEYYDGVLLIHDTDFHEKLGAGFIFSAMLKVFLVLFPVLVLLGGFWLWMLIDVAQRSLENKTLWILIIIFVGFVGAVLYYFLVRRKQKKVLEKRVKN